MSRLTSTNQVVGLVAAGLVIVALIVSHQLRSADTAAPPLELASVASDTTEVDRAGPPTVAGRLLPAASIAPEPRQWDGGPSGIPTGQWWSSGLVGPGTHSMWAKPLTVKIDESGEILLAALRPELDEDGTTVTPFVPALFLRGSGTSGDLIRVTDSGAFHVTLTRTGGDDTLSMTLVQGSPFLELDAGGRLTWLVPGLELKVISDRSVRIATSQGSWVLASDEPMTAEAAGDELQLELADNARLVVGPELGDEWINRAVAMAVAPVRGTSEVLTVDDDGSVTQRLVVQRAGGVASSFVLQPHQVSLSIDDTIEQRADDRGTPFDILTGTDLELNYPAVPVLWEPSVAGDHAKLAGLIESDLEVAGPTSGSYFAGKEALRLAQLGQLALGIGDERLAEQALDHLELLLVDLVDSGGGLDLTWDPQWGTVVLQPAEFGLGTELNDHSLQYGYWVAAASVLEQHRPGAVVGLRDAIDLLIGDYGGAGLLADSFDGLPLARTWSPYEGHSWASGLAPFDAGNNLESVSESAHAWWASARWLTITDRSDEANESIARFTIESFLATSQWLPIASGPDRPWSGVVWSSKVDNETWFDPRPEAALGIRLLPLTPGSLARYATEDQHDSVVKRWQWCADNGGCTGYWSNLLDSDAAAAGLALLPTDSESEASTSSAMAYWWRELISEYGLPAPNWVCSPGLVALERADRSASVAVSTATAGSCRHRTTGFETPVPAGSTTGLPLPLD